MIEQTRDGGDAASRKLEERKEFHSYVWGIALALMLTLVPFALVHWAAMPGLSLLSVIGAFALVQMVVHFRFFLHNRLLAEARRPAADPVLDAVIGHHGGGHDLDHGQFGDAHDPTGAALTVGLPLALVIVFVRAAVRELMACIVTLRTSPYRWLQGCLSCAGDDA